MRYDCIFYNTQAELRQRLVEETEAHVVVRLLLGLLLLLLSGGGVATGSGSGTTSSGGTSGGGTATTDVGEHLLDVLALKSLGEERSVDLVDLELGSRGKGDELVGLEISYTS